MAEQKIPKPVQVAQGVLEALEQTQKQSLQKKLPAYALHLARSGVEVTAVLLQDHIAQDLVTQKRKTAPQTKTYQKVAEKFLPADRAGRGQGNFLGLLGLALEQGETIEDMQDRLKTDGYTGYLKYFIEEKNLDLTPHLKTVVEGMLRGEEREALSYLTAQSYDWTTYNQVLSFSPSADFIDYLLDAEYDFAARDIFISALRQGQTAAAQKIAETYPEEIAGRDYSDCALSAARNQFYDTVYYLESTGLGQPSATTEKDNASLIEYAAHKDNISKWHNMHGHMPAGCHAMMPELYKKEAWRLIFDALTAENTSTLHAYHERENIRGKYAYQASSLLRSEDAVLRYLDKWGRPGKTPLHDLIYMIDLPEKSQTQPYDLKAWGDAVLQCGPDMARLVKFAGKMAEERMFGMQIIPGRPKKTSDGRRYSLRETQHAVAQFAYERASENPRLATMCIHHYLSDDDFSTILDLVNSYEAKDNHIPDITVSGESFGLEGYHFRKLEDGDVRGLFLGSMTDCCQYIGAAGEECAKHGFSSENGGFYVVEDKKGRVVAQSWAWRGEEGELVLDSLEYLGDRMKPQNWQDICHAVAEKLQENKSDITALHIGTGGKTPALSFKEASRPATPKDYTAYRDSRQQYQVWKM